jgi:hypothetical protein
MLDPTKLFLIMATVSAFFANNLRAAPSDANDLMSELSSQSTLVLSADFKIPANTLTVFANTQTRAGRQCWLTLKNRLSADLLLSKNSVINLSNTHRTPSIMSPIHEVVIAGPSPIYSLNCKADKHFEFGSPATASLSQLIAAFAGSAEVNVR